MQTCKNLSEFASSFINLVRTLSQISACTHPLNSPTISPTTYFKSVTNYFLSLSDKFFARKNLKIDGKKLIHRVMQASSGYLPIVTTHNLEQSCLTGRNLFHFLLYLYYLQNFWGNKNYFFFSCRIFSHVADRAD